MFFEKAGETLLFLIILLVLCPIPYWIGKQFNLDIRRQGNESNSISNLYRVLKQDGVKGARLVWACDFFLEGLKGFVPTWFVALVDRENLLFALLLLSFGHGVSTKIGKNKKWISGSWNPFWMGMSLAFLPTYFPLVCLGLWCVGQLSGLEELGGYLVASLLCGLACFVSILIHDWATLTVYLFLFLYLTNGFFQRLRSGKMHRVGVYRVQIEINEVLVGFEVCPGTDDEEETKALFVEKLAKKFPLCKGVVSCLSAGFVCHHLMRFVPPNLYVMGDIQGIKPNSGHRVHMRFRAAPIIPNGRSHYLLGKDPEKWVREQGIRLAQEGCKVIGLGGNTTLAGEYGKPLEEILKSYGAAVTTGNTYTGVAGPDGLVWTARQCGIDITQATVLIVGAAGSTGRVALHYLSQKHKPKLILAAGRSLEQMKASYEFISGSGVEAVELSYEVLQRADLVITVTSSGDLGIDPTWWKPGTIVCDIARPRNVRLELMNIRPDVLVIDGAIVSVKTEDYARNFDFGLPKGMYFACMAETQIVALKWAERGFDPNWEYACYSVGKALDIARAFQIAKWAEELGYKVVGARSGETMLSPERLKKHGRYIQATR